MQQSTIEATSVSSIELIVITPLASLIIAARNISNNTS
jgi:hypothetical protein